MKKRIWIGLLSLVLIVAFAFPAMAVWKDMHATVYKWTGGYNQDGSPGLTRLTSGVIVSVLKYGNDSLLETLYVADSQKFTSLANPITATLFASSSYCNGEVAFRVDPAESGDAKVDLIVTDTSGGYTAVVQGFNEYTHTIIIDERPNVVHHGQVRFSYSTTDQTSTGITLLSGALLHKIITSVTTNLANTYVAVGTGQDASAIKAGDSLASKGWVQTSYESEGSIWKMVWSTHSGGYFMYPVYGSVMTNDTSLTYSVSSGGTPAANAQTGSIHFWFSYGPK